MFEKLNIDWDLLHRQKLTLVGLLWRSNRKRWISGRRQHGEPGSVKLTKSEREAVDGLVELLDDLQDEAAAAGLWAYPE
jgi:hypothetical protein